MTEKEVTPPPTTTAASSSSPLTPNPKRARMSSPNGVAQATEEQRQTSESAVAALESAPEAVTSELLNEHDELEADDGASDSGFGSTTDDGTSISSSIYAGFMENGRRYQTKREGEYWGPSDEKQFESMQACHILHHILDSKTKNPLFQAPIPDSAQNILDVGTGTGAWATEVADKYPGAFVQGVDLYPPPETWVPPNCKFEVDDVLKPWLYQEKFDLIHFRYIYGSFTDEQWRLVYKQAYNNLAPGGWIEQMESSISFDSDDGTLASDSLLADWGPSFTKLCAKIGKGIDTEQFMKSRIEAAGFTNVHEKRYKVPLGEWAKNATLKEAGKFQKLQLLSGMEGYTMYLLTKFGEPEPWSPEEVQVYLAKVRNEMTDPKLHAYLPMRRVWAQKPYDTEPEVDKEVEVNTVV